MGLLGIQATRTYQPHIGDSRPALPSPGTNSVTSVIRLLSRERSLSYSEKEAKPSKRRKVKEKSLSSLYFAQEDSTRRDFHRTNFFPENQPQA